MIHNLFKELTYVGLWGTSLFLFVDELVQMNEQVEKVVFTLDTHTAVPNLLYVQGLDH